MESRGYRANQSRRRGTVRSVVSLLLLILLRLNILVIDSRDIDLAGRDLVLEVVQVVLLVIGRLREC